MALEIASSFVTLVGAYIALGIVFAIPFLLRGVRTIDPAASDGSVGFRIMILPGVVAFWPLLLTRWLRGGDEPPRERGPHRDAARPSTNEGSA